MECKCKSELEEKIESTDYHGKKVLKAELEAMIVFSNPMELYTTSNVRLTIEGRKTKVDIPVKHSYCPFCGKKSDNEVEGGATKN